MLSLVGVSVGIVYPPIVTPVVLVLPLGDATALLVKVEVLEIG